MKKLLVAFALALFSVAAAQDPAPAQKTIKDPAEHNAYVGAVGQQDPQARISGIEGFLAQYPGSVMKEDALEVLMGAYQQTGNAPKSMDAAARLLQEAPSNVRGLLVMAFTKRSAAEANQNPAQNLKEAREYSERGLKALVTLKPQEGVTPEQFATLKKQFGIYFHATVGLAALQVKDFPAAQEHLRAAVEENPSDLGNVYPLSLSYLTAEPPNDVTGLWFVARAANLAPNAASQKQISDFGRKKYIRYHGDEEGWKELLAQTKATPFPPDGFTVKPAPTPAERAAQMVEKTPVKQMNFAEFEFILGVGGEPAQKVWGQIKGVPLQFQGRVISATRNKLQIAATADAIDAKRADVEVTMAAALTVRQVPAAGADILLEATPAEFTPEPFVMKMAEGVLLTRAAPARRRGR